MVTWTPEAELPRGERLQLSAGGGSHLDFDGEEEGGGEGVDGGHAGDGARLAVRVTGLQVSMSKGKKPPDHREEHPGAEEGGGEDEEGVLPLQVHHGGEDVLQEAALKPAERRHVYPPAV